MTQFNKYKQVFPLAVSFRSRLHTYAMHALFVQGHTIMTMLFFCNIPTKDTR